MSREESIHFICALPEFPPKSGGLGTFYGHLAQILGDCGHWVTILTAQDEQPPPLNSPNVSIHNLQNQQQIWFQRLLQLFPDGHHLSALSCALGMTFRDFLSSGIVREPAPTVLLAPEFLGYASLLQNSIFPPTIITAHGSIGQIQQRSIHKQPPPDLSLVAALESEALLRADVAHAYSPDNTREWENTLQHPIHFAPPPFVFPKTSTSEPALAAPPILRGIVVGRLQDWKGAIELCQALRLLQFPHSGDASTTTPNSPFAHPPITIDWFGADTPTAPDGSSMAAHLAQAFPDIFGSMLHWHGPAPREVVRQKQAEADFALVPSNWDTLNFTALEAMAQGTPLVISTGAGAHFLVAEGRAGFLHQPQNPQSLANALSAAIQHATQLPAIGQTARDHLRQALHPQTLAASYTRLAIKARERRQHNQSSLANTSAAPSLLANLLAAANPASVNRRQSTRSLLQAFIAKFR